VIEQWLKAVRRHVPAASAAAILMRYRQAISALDLGEIRCGEHNDVSDPSLRGAEPQPLRLREELHHFREALAETERGLKRVFAD